MKLMKKLIFLGSMLGAYLIDTALFIILIYLLKRLSVMAYVIVLVLKFFYRVVTTGLWGSTIGMRLLRLRLNRYNLKLCLKREIYRIGSAMFFLGYILPLFDAYGRTLHDMAAGTIIVYGKERGLPSPGTKLGFKLAAIIMVGVSASSWCIGFLMDDVGLMGLRRVAVSGEYYQSFEGDNLLSLSQNELYLKSIGRKYTTPVEYEDGTHLLRISNKRDYTELYRLDVSGDEITGEYIGSTSNPLQFICSGVFRSKLEMVGLSPSGNIYFMDNTGRSYGEGKLSIDHVVTLSCGDLDRDGRDEATVMGRNGAVEIFKYKDGKVLSLYSGRIGEDILAETFYIPGDLVISGEQKDNRVLYTYSYDNNTLTYKSKAVLDTDGAGRIAGFGDDAVISYIYRNNMIFNVGRVQRLEVYRVDGKARRLYNFGNRTGRRYDYLVRSLENIDDLDGDGKEEIILKAMKKDEVEGERYRIEIYKLSPFWLGVNRVVTLLEGLMRL